MILPLLLAAVTFAALLPIVLPLLRGARAEAEPARFDRAVYRDQLQELDRDVARGLLNHAEAQTARLEIQRRLLATDLMPARAARSTRNPILAGIVAVLTAGGALGLYTVLGAPGIPDMPASAQLADKAASPHGNDDMAKAADKLAARLKEQPNDANGWLLFARTNMLLSRWEVAAGAYRRALNLGITAPEAVAAYGEALVTQASGVVTPEAQAAFNQALKEAPTLETARYYQALALAQAGEAKQAIEQWQALLQNMPEDNPARSDVVGRMSETALAANLPVPAPAKGPPAAASGGPDEAAMQAAAAMPAGERKAMIETMVARLAEKLKEQPDDVDGWMKLGRAYAVMKDDGKAADAFSHAMALRPADAGIKLQAVDTLLSEVPPEQPFPAAVSAWLRQLQTEAPDELMVLWYGGIQDARDGKPDAARTSWSKLLTRLPADGEDAKMVKAAIGALRKS